MNQIKLKRCPVCRKMFEYVTIRVNSQRKKTLRGRRTVTCSKPCSRIYQDCVLAYRNTLYKKKESKK